MAQVIKTTFKLRRGLLETWERVNPILSDGEPGWATDASILKIGDGITPWNELNAISDIDISTDDIEAAVDKYIQEHPIAVETDVTLSTAGSPADAAAVKEHCVFYTDQLILYAGTATI